MDVRARTSDPSILETLREGVGSDFEILKELGRGSVATVYLAKERGLERLVAIKVLDPGKARDETTRRRFEREARAAASLSHPKIVRVFRFGRLPDETPYLVMRYVKGRTMEERLKAEGRLSADLATRVLRDVASALTDAHSRGIVHRDVKPGNVLWDEEREEALLTDFGIAAIVAESGEEVTRLTKTGQMVGDPRYMSPEQLLDEDVTELADVYALGVLGYELLTGESPYEARTNMQWITAHLNAEPRDLSVLRPDVDPRLADVLRRCLNKEPKHRPSAADLVRALDGDPSAALARGSGSVEEAADLQQLIKRRVPQIIVIAAAAGYGLLQGVALLVERGTLGELAWDLSLPLVVCGVVASTVVAWFHGERGRQETKVLEWILLSVIGVAWLSISSWIVLGG